MNQLMEYVALGWIDSELAKRPPEQRAAIQALWETDLTTRENGILFTRCSICYTIGSTQNYDRPDYERLYLCNECLKLIFCELNTIVIQLEQDYPGLREALESVVEPQPVLNLCSEDDTGRAEWDISAEALLTDANTLVEQIIGYYKEHPAKWAVIRNQNQLKSKQLRPALQLPSQMDNVDLHCISRPLNKHLLELGYERKYEPHPSGDGRMVELLVLADDGDVPC